MIAENIYFATPYFFSELPYTILQRAYYAGGYMLRDYPADFLSENYIMLILIVLMVVALRVHKSIESNVAASGNSGL